MRADPQLQSCVSCPRHCRVNRYKKSGFCGLRAELLISHIGLHHGEEPPISGTKGSGTIFFSGCNLRCVFCQNFQISQAFQQGVPGALTTRRLSREELVDEIFHLQEMGAHNINLVSPSHILPQLTATLRLAKNNGLNIPVVYNSNGYDSVTALKNMRGLVDIYLPDIKYRGNDLGRRYSGVPDYGDIIPGVLAEMLSQVGLLQTDENGIARRGLLVRHLVLPGHLTNSRECLRLLKNLSSDITLSIMSQYAPCHLAHEFPEINRPLTPAEYDEITDYALDLGLEHAFVQDMSSQGCLMPDFNQPQPFTS
ncbi:radical SAM protein [Desulfobacterota bacterium M19]